MATKLLANQQRNWVNEASISVDREAEMLPPNQSFVERLSAIIGELSFIGFMHPRELGHSEQSFPFSLPTTWLLVPRNWKGKAWFEHAWISVSLVSLSCSLNLFALSFCAPLNCFFLCYQTVLLEFHSLPCVSLSFRPREKSFQSSRVLRGLFLFSDWVCQHMRGRKRRAVCKTAEIACCWRGSVYDHMTFISRLWKLDSYRPLSIAFRALPRNLRTSFLDHLLSAELMVKARNLSCVQLLPAQFKKSNTSENPLNLVKSN